LLIALLLVLAAVVKGFVTGVIYASDGDVSDNELWTITTILHLVIPAAVGFIAGRRSWLAPAWVLLCPASLMVAAHFSGFMSGEWAFFGFVLAVVFAIAEFIAALAGVAIGDWLRVRARDRS
jgi:hypothetical protein